MQASGLELLSRRRTPLFLTNDLEVETHRAMPSGRAACWAAMLTLTAAGLAPTSAGATALGVKTDPTDEAKADRTGVAETEGQGAPAKEVHSFDIAAGPLAEVMEAIRKQAGIRISFGSEQNMAGIASPGVHGVVTVADALAQALGQSGLAARFEMPDSVMIEVRSNHESVVVTADALPGVKYTAPLVDLPVTISVVTQETMQNTASTTLMDALRTVPGITFGAGEGGNPLGDRPFIRGQDSQASTYIDGIRDIAAQSREVFDIDSIEVQEGPGGAYGGRGTGGGSINMNSKLAQRSNFLAGSFMPGTQNYKRGTVDGGMKLGEWVSARLTGMWFDADTPGRGPVHNNRWGIAPSLAIGLGHPTRAYLDYYHLIANNLPDSGVPYNNPVSTVGALHDLGFARILQPGDGEPIKLPYRDIFWGLKDRDKDREYAKIATGRVERDMFHEHGLLRSSFRYEHVSQDYLWTLPDDSQGNLYYGLLFRRINTKINSVFTDDNQTDLSGQTTTGKIKHSYATGFEWSKERSNVDSLTNNSTTFSITPQFPVASESCPRGAGAASGYNCTSLFSPNPDDPWTNTGFVTKGHNPAHYNAGTESAYGFDTITFNKHFMSTVGARYDHYDTLYTPIKGATTGPQHVINNIGTYLASLTYKPDHVTSIYGTVSTAAIPTGNALAQGTDVSSLATAGNNNLQPEKIREEEFGAKREMYHDKALAYVDFYRLDIQNVRITNADGTVSVAGNNVTLGAEIGISGMLTHEWQFTGGYSYIDGKLVNTGNVLTSGTAMPNTAKHGVSVTSSYHITQKLTAGGGIYGLSMVWGSQANKKWVPGYVREDIFGNYVINRHLNLQANLQNLSNKLYYQQAYATHYAVLAPARSAVFGINAKW